MTLALYVERLPAALHELPFVKHAAVAAFPPVLERGIRPPGTFFEFFRADDEASYWAYAQQEFEAFGYERFASGLPAGTPNALRIGL